MERPRLDKLGEILHVEGALALFIESRGLNPDKTSAKAFLELLVRSTDAFDALSNFRSDVRSEAVLRNGGTEP